MSNSDMFASIIRAAGGNLFRQRRIFGRRASARLLAPKWRRRIAMSFLPPAMAIYVRYADSGALVRGALQGGVFAVVFVNRSYSTGTNGLRRAYPNGVAVRTENYEGGIFDPPPDFAKLAEAANCFGETVSEPEEVGPALKAGSNRCATARRR